MALGFIVAGIYFGFMYEKGNVSLFITGILSAAISVGALLHIKVSSPGIALYKKIAEG
jgi:hypothetical protein